jgi:2-iminobutanoate/2-iminopropanoate deaminase
VHPDSSRPTTTTAAARFTGLGRNKGPAGSRGKANAGRHSVQSHEEHLLLVSGQLALREGALIGDEIRDQTHQTLENLEAVLQDHGLDRTHVVRCQVFLPNMDDWEGMNDVFGSFFPEPLPARTTVGTALVRGALVEIDAIAHGPRH